MNAGKHNSGWDLGFLFLANQLALDLLNTRPAPNGLPIELIPDFPSLLNWCQAARILRTQEAKRLRNQWGKSDRAADVLREVHQFRETLRGEVLRWEGGGHVSRAFVRELNALLEHYPMREKLVPSASRLGCVQWFEAREPEDLLGPLAHAAAQLFTSADRERVRKCDHCVAHFCDTSKKGKRRWCSMQVCGNRLKVAAYAARNRGRRRIAPNSHQDPA